MTLSTRLLPLATVAVAASQLFASPDLPQQSHDAAVNRNLNTFNSIVKAVEMNYVDTIIQSSRRSVRAYAQLCGQYSVNE